MTSALLLAIGLTAILLAVLARFDPKRLRSLHRGHPARRLRPLPSGARASLWLLLVVGGAVFARLQSPAAALIWLGSTLLCGWLMARLAAPRQGGRR